MTSRSESPSAKAHRSALETGPNSLPIIGHKGAPKKFTGKFNEVKLFLQHYERLCAQKNITLDEEKVENITQYCSRHVREFMEGLPSYTSRNWTAFSKDILKFYDAEKDTRRYKYTDLENYVQKSRGASTFKDLAAWKKYNREFIRIAGWLLSNGKITQTELNLYF
ncbi:uncharacterized protein PHACADRAFT_109112, partial [Phanerochaete carnosa HHB-10118-sp]